MITNISDRKGTKFLLKNNTLYKDFVNDEQLCDGMKIYRLFFAITP